MTNHQFEEVEELIRGSSMRLNECPTCGSKAQVYGDAIEWQGGAYLLDRKSHPCDCEEQELLFRHYLLARIPQEYMNLDVAIDWEGDKDAAAAAVAYLDKWENLRRHGLGLGFYGSQGTGKTFLAMWIAKELVKRGESVYCISFRLMIEIYQLPYDKRAEEEKRLRDCTVLILDEVSRGASDAQHALFAEKFENLIRHRSNYNKVTILTSNLTPEKLDDIYPRTYSLLAAKEQSIKVNGEDHRRETLQDHNKELAYNGEARPIT